MYEFFVGIVLGVFGTRIFSKKQKECKDSSIQVDSLPALMVASTPIPMTRKSFIPGALSNFWGKDS